MADITVSSDVDTLLQSSDNNSFRENLGLGVRVVAAGSIKISEGAISTASESSSISRFDGVWTREAEGRFLYTFNESVAASSYHYMVQVTLVGSSRYKNDASIISVVNKQNSFFNVTISRDLDTNTTLRDGDFEWSILVFDK
jgi:hypothetical protein